MQRNVLRMGNEGEGDYRKLEARKMKGDALSGFLDAYQLKFKWVVVVVARALRDTPPCFSGAGEILCRPQPQKGTASECSELKVWWHSGVLEGSRSNKCQP